LTDDIPDKQDAYDDSKIRIRSMLENTKLRKLAQEKATKLYEKYKAAKNLRTEAGKDLKVMETGLVASSEPIKGVDESGSASRALFTLKTNQIAEPIEAMDGMMIVQLTQIVAPIAEPFEKAQVKAKSDLEQSRKNDLLKADADRVLPLILKATDDKALEELLKKENLKSEKTEYRRGNRLASFTGIKNLDQTVFAMEPNSWSQPLVFTTDVALIRVKSKTLSTEIEFKSKRDEFFAKKTGELQGSVFRQYVTERRKQYPIRMNNQIFEQIKEYVVSRFH
jgi:hypothetical protein